MSEAILISHDIGGFRLVYEYLKRKYQNLELLISGPALLEANEKSLKTMDCLDDSIKDNCDIYITTGSSNLERHHMKVLNDKDVDWIGVIDNWNLYPERFLFAGIKYLPKSIIVFDKYAYKLCREIYPDIPTCLVPNYFDLEFIKSFEKMKKFKKTDKINDLFLADPISVQYGDSLGYDEFDQILYIIEKNIGRYSKNFRLCIRPHPSEDPKKYLSFLAKKNLKNVFISEQTLLEDIHDADLVYGDSSYGMHLADLVEKPIICSIPVKSFNSQLPHSNLRYLRDLSV